MNLPNIFTLLRIILTPVMVILVIYGWHRAALAVFTVAGVTDALDGFLARILEQQTLAGRLLDPLADKMLLVSSYISLSITGLLPAWLTVIVISRDVIILAGVLLLSVFVNEVEIAPSAISKCTTVGQLASVFFLLCSLADPCFSMVLEPVFVLTAVLTVFSGMHYIFLGYRILINANIIPE